MSSAVAVRCVVDSAAASKQQKEEAQHEAQERQLAAHVDGAGDRTRTNARGRLVQVLGHDAGVWRPGRTRSNPTSVPRTRRARRWALDALGRGDRNAGSVAPMETDDPQTTARAAADRAGVSVLDGRAMDRDGLVALADLFGEVWGRDPAMGPIVSAEILWATAHVGNPVVAAFSGDRLVGGTVGFVGVRDRTLRVHSHLTGVAGDAAGRGIGRALKWHQRAWCLARDITEVEWTFDPLVRRNAVVNLVHLGARPATWLDDLYGPMEDDRNAGLPTDRLLVRWGLTEARVQQAALGRAAEPRVEGLLRAGAEVVLDEDDAGAPVLTPTTGPRRLVRVPRDIESLRTRDRDLAAAWAGAVRDALGGGLRAGMRITGVTRDGWYVLVAPDGVAEMA